MFHIVEFEGVRKTVKAKPSATCTDVAALAFGFDPWGDTRTANMTVIGSTKSKDIAAGMMCRVWPVRRPCACEVCDPSCGKSGCAGFIRIHSAMPDVKCLDCSAMVPWGEPCPSCGLGATA